MACQSPASTIRTVEAGKIDLQGRLLPVMVRVDRRAKRLIMRVEPSGRIRVTCPHQRDIGAALAMAESRRDWIGSRLEEMPQPVPFVPGAHVPVLGRYRLIIRDPLIKSASLDDYVLRIGGPAVRDPGPAIIRLLKRHVQEACRGRADRFAAQLGVTLGKIRVRDMKTRWGSCTARGDLTFNWRLAHAPEAVLNYVVAHEVAHRRHMDHSPAFWAQVKAISPDYRDHERWLREEGRMLFRYGAEAIPPASVDAA